LVSLEDLGIIKEVEETGRTFEENARLKAWGYASMAQERQAAPLLVLADDSGLEVDALGGEPGVWSARYGGDPNASDRDRVELLLRKLEGVPWEQRTARFRCIIAIAHPKNSPHPSYRRGDGPILSVFEGKGCHLVVGSVAGMVQYKPVGTDGFGYDPIFYLPSYGLTMAQLSLEEKNRISHRADAAHKAVAILRQLAL
jgi:XTP/dITP diphosphohydrolase